MKKFRLLVLAMAFTLAFTGLAQAVPLTVDGGWVLSSFLDVGSSFNPQPWTFTLAGLGLLTVTDAYNAGDQFEVFDNGVSLGLTSLPTGTVSDYTENFDEAAASSLWSTGFFCLVAGEHSITGIAVLSPFAQGAVALRVDSGCPAPIPGAFWLLGGGLIGLLAGRKR